MKKVRRALIFAIMVVSLYMVNVYGIKVSGITVDGLDGDWKSYPKMSDSKNDAANDMENVKATYWYTDENNVYICLERYAYYQRGSKEDYSEYENVTETIVDTPEGSVVLNHNNGKIDFLYDVNYNIDFTVNQVKGKTAEVVQDVYNHTITVTCFDNGEEIYTKTYTNVENTEFTEIIIPLNILVEQLYGGYELDYIVLTASDRTPDNGVVLVSSVSTMGVSLLLALIIGIILLIWRNKKLWI